MTTLTIDAKPRHRTFPGNLSSLSTKDWPAPLPSSYIDTISLNAEEVVVKIFDLGLEQMRNVHWFHPTVRALLELLWLPDSWNSYGSKRVEPRAIEKLLDTLISILEPNTPPPAVVPTSEGGVQVEWHRNQIDFEIEATSSGELSFFFKGPAEEQEGPVEEDRAALKKYVRTI